MKKHWTEWAAGAVLGAYALFLVPVAAWLLPLKVLAPDSWAVVGGLEDLQAPAASLLAARVAPAVDDRNEAWRKSLDSCTASGGVPTNVSIDGGGLLFGGDWSFECVTRTPGR